MIYNTSTVVRLFRMINERTLKKNLETVDRCYFEIRHGDCLPSNVTKKKVLNVSDSFHIVILLTDAYACNNLKDLVHLVEKNWKQLVSTAHT